VGNKPKTQPQNERRAKVEALKRQQKAAERRKTMRVVGVAVVVAAALIAVPTVKIMKDRSAKTIPLSEIGVLAAGAQCGDPLIDTATGSQDHVTGHVDYAQIPPSSGKHNGTPATVNARGFYTTADVPQVEELVHNLEHGYTILWYLPSSDPRVVADVKKIANRMRDETKYHKFIAAPWDVSRGNFPKGKPIALSHWGAKQGFRQYCGIVSGEAVENFVKAHPSSDSPEPGAA
jgi:hypothetical protein